MKIHLMVVKLSKQHCLKELLKMQDVYIMK